MEVDKRKESILVKLAKYGADTEKKVIAIDKVEVIDFCLSSGLKLEDVHTVYEIQDAIKHNKIYSYLTSGVDKKEEKPNVKPREVKQNDNRNERFERVEGTNNVYG